MQIAKLSTAGQQAHGELIYFQLKKAVRLVRGQIGEPFFQINVEIRSKGEEAGSEEKEHRNKNDEPEGSLFPGWMFAVQMALGFFRLTARPGMHESQRSKSLFPAGLQL